MMDFTFWDCGVFFAFLVGIFLIYDKWKLGRFERHGVKGLKTYPVFGNFGSVLVKKEHFLEATTRAYASFPDEKYIGFFQIQKPFLLIRDLELIKQITVKDFEHFEDHMPFFDEENDSVFGKSLIALRGQKWRDMRATLSPAFTSSKMRNMFAFIEECSERLSKYYVEEMKKVSNSNVLEIELKDTFTRYANDVIATSAFGITIDSISDKNNEFYLMGKQVTTFKFWQMLKSLISVSVPFITKIVKISVFDTKMTDFFKKIVSDQMKYRKEHNVVRPDMIHLLMEAKKGSLKHENETPTADAGFATVQESSIGSRTIKREWSDDELIAQAILFFFAGFETVSTLMSFMGLELAINQNIQKKLQDEIDDLSKENENITYDMIQKMKYMDMVVSETLRLWPPAIIADRRCVKSYTFPPPHPGGKPYQMEPNEALWLPMYSIHRDPRYFDRPDVFDPERFSDENKSKILPFTYLPFGLGPRNCIGSRFALMEIKCVMFHMLSKFDFVTVSKTCNPIVIDRKAFNFSAEGGFWIGLKSRE